MKNQDRQKWLFFGSQECNTCKRQLKEILSYFNLENINLVFIDAFADDRQDFCDKHGIDPLPHIKIYSSDGKLIFEHIGYIDSKDIEANLIGK